MEYGEVQMPTETIDFDEKPNKKGHTKSIRERFYEKITMVPECGCWIWMNGTNEHGYGLMRIGHVLVKAHRISYEMHIGEIPPGINVLHRCDTPACASPYHLFLGTQTDNMQDFIKKGRKKNIETFARWENHTRTHLTNEQVKKILTDSRIYKEIAAEYSIALVTVGRIKQRRAWVGVEHA
jgi:hypothetical protein